MHWICIENENVLFEIDRFFWGLQDELRNNIKQFRKRSFQCDNLNQQQHYTFTNLDHIIVNFCYLHPHSVHLQFALEICMKRPTRRRHSPSHRVHHLLAGPLQPLPHHHRQVSQAAGVRVQVKLTWKHCSAALVKKEEDAQKKGFWSTHRPFVSSNWKRQALLIFTASWNANLMYHPMFMGSLFIQANYLPHHLLTQLPPHILVNLCFFLKFSYFDRSRSPPAPAHPASVDQLKALPTVAPRQRWKGSADTGVITPRTPPSPRLNVPSPGFRNCPQNYHPGTRLKKGLFRHLLLTWYWAGWCRLFKKFKT